MDGQLNGARGVALVVRFLLELALLAGAVAWALAALPDPWRWIVAVVGPVAIAVLWGLLLAPRRRVEIGGVGRLVIETVLFLGVAAGLVSVGLWLPAVIGVVIWALDRLALALLPQSR